MAPRSVATIGAELDLGAGRRGVDMGPSAIRYAGLSERLAPLGMPSSDWGNVDVELQETTATGDERARYLGQIRAACEQIAERVRAAVEQHPWTAIHPELRVTLSVGVCARTDVANHERMLSLADEKLYEAKRAGRNLVAS